MSELILAEVLRKIFLQEAVKEAVRFFKDYLKPKAKTIEYDQSYFTASLQQTITKTVNWSNNIFFSGLIRDKFTDDIHVDLDFYLTPLRETLTAVEKKGNLIREVFNQTQKHIIILGEGGSGKSTSMQKLCRNMLMDEHFLPEYAFPLVIRFREQNQAFRQLGNHVTTLDNIHYSTYNGQLLFATLFRELGLSYKNEGKNAQVDIIYDIQTGFLKKYVIEALNFLRPVIILDGFDEIDYDLRKIILEEINELCLGLSHARVVITCRTGEFEYTIHNAHKFQLAPLDEEKIRKFCSNWFNDAEKGKLLFDQIQSTPFYDTTMRPMNLTLLAASYEVNGFLPPKPKSVYKDIIDLQISKWDKQRNVVRYSAHLPDHNMKFDFLSNLAYHLSKENAIVFDIYKLAFIYKDVLANKFSLPVDLFETIMNDLEIQSGIFIQSARNKFEFPHKSIQEYLAGEYLAKYQPIDELKDVLVNIPNEFALATCLGNNPNYLFIRSLTVFGIGTNSTHANFIIYLRKLIVEKVDFDVSAELGYYVVQLWICYIANDPKLKTDFLKFYELKGVGDSIKKLEELYRIDPEVHLVTRFTAKEKLRENQFTMLYRVHLREPWKHPKNERSFLVPLFFIRDWKYMRKY